jgi:hypothetical protein
MGRPRRYCAGACRQAAYRKRERAALRKSHAAIEAIRRELAELRARLDGR